MESIMTDRNVRVHKQHLKLNRVDVGAKKAEFAVELDVFDRNVLINKMTDICQLCKGDHFDGELMHKRFTSLEGSGEHEDGERESCPDELDPEGIWASRYSIQNNSNRRLFVHFNCALYAPQISFNGVTWSNMRKEIQRGNFLSCFHCRKKGSTILCSQTRCNYIVHLSCAVKEGFRPSRFVNTAGYFCRIHAAENSTVEKELDKQVESDISLGRETIPVIKRDDSEDTPLPQGFEYITRNVDSDSVTATPQNVCSDEFQCCDCVGLCNDINQCACLQAEYQRNYSSVGKLIPGAEKPIIECNMRCNCSVNRCTNRVVERGLQYPLQIFRRKSPVGNVLIGCVDKDNGASAIVRKRPRQSGFDDKGWGVLTMEDIPLGAFVCEIAGQYVDADSLSISAKVKQRLMGANSAEGAPTLNDCLDNHIIPLSFWEAGASEGCVSGYGIHGSSSSSTSLLGSRESTAILIDDSAVEKTVINLDADSEESQAIEGDLREPEARHAAPMDACSNTNTITNTDEPPDFFKGLICIDCNKFGNVGRFIRHRPKERKMAKSATASTSPSSQPMLIRRLIYTNAQDRRYPKVALFAARKISANTELLI